VIRAGEGNVMRSDHAPFAAVLLSACPPGARRDLHVMTAEPGGARDAHAHLPGTTEHVVVAAGRWRGGAGGGRGGAGARRLRPLPGDRPHSYEALEPGSSAVLVMEHR
jgi:hypothetical protein